jgi:CheY-like chemotaxis protein
MLIMKTFLNNDNGYLIDIAKNGAQATEMLEKRDYKLVLLKMHLPDMAGDEMINQIRTNPNKQISELRILMVSGSSMKKEQEEVISAGASAFLAKPYTKKELFSKIASLVNL